jgi:hypothetical protein
MTAVGQAVSTEEEIDLWRSFLRDRQAAHSVDVAELEDRLREQIAVLVDAGLAGDEAFLVALKRMGELDAISREFGREHASRLWGQLVGSSSEPREPQGSARTDAIVAFSLALAAAVLIKTPALFGVQLDAETGFYARNLTLFVLPLLTGYFAWKRRLGAAILGRLAAAYGAAAVIANVYPFARGGSTEALTALHMPVALWLLVGIAYAGHRWNESAGRMDFVRFSGELFIYYVLIALGGGVLTAFMAMIFQAVGIDIEPFFESWLLPCGAMGAVVVGAWLVDTKQRVIENIAPVLARLFTPLFAAVLIAFLATLLWTGRALELERTLLIGFDLLLVVVLGLLLYSVSARKPFSPPDAFDVAQVVLVVSALLVNAVALWAVAARITEFGFSPNRIAALGLNVVLLINLAWSAVLYIRFIRGRALFTKLERWQTDYLPVYALWAAIVVVAFPPVFGFT